MTLAPCWRNYQDHPGDDGTLTDEEEREEARRFWEVDLRGTTDDEEEIDDEKHM